MKKMTAAKNTSKTHQKTLMLCLCAVFTALTAVGAYIRIPIPIVPFTLQYPITMLAGIILGGRYGAMSVGAYVVLGLLGLPIFTEGGGIYYVLKPSFGYLIGFIIGTYVTGKIAHAVAKPSYKRILLANFTGMMIVYAIGIIYCYLVKNFWVAGDGISAWVLILHYFLLVVPGDIVFCFLGAWLGKRLIPLTSHMVKPSRAG
jgi:biotin transport system substrate-specific component